MRGGRTDRPSATDRIDGVVTHRFFGPVVLLLVMALVFQAIFSWATLPMDLIDRGFGALGELVRAQMPAGLLTDLLVDGVIAGVGGVLVFLPQILLLFFFIALLEDSGYMSRAAFLMDRLMRGVGLHGKAFMPLSVELRVRDSGHHGDAHHREPEGQAGDDHDRAVHVLLGAFAGLHADDRRVLH